MRGKCDTQLQLLEAWREEMNSKLPDRVQDVSEIDDSIWQYVLKKIDPWSAPGRDGIQGFWWR